MLAVYDRQAIRHFAGLKQIRIAGLGNRGGFETKHRPERYGLPPKLARDHRHEPIDRIKFVLSPIARLLGVHKEGTGMKHERPVSKRTVQHRWRFGSRLRFDARS